MNTRPTAERDAHGMGWEKVHRDLTSRLGFGDGVTEPMADNDTIVAWFEEQSRLANEWTEHELWRGDCYAAGHPDDEDCDEHGPTCCNRAHIIPPGEPDTCICDPAGPCLGAEHDAGSTIECKACLKLDPELPCLNDPEVTP